MREKLRQLLISRNYITILLFILQLLFYVIIAKVLIQYSIIIQVIAYILSAMLAIYILSMKNTSIYIKIPFIILIILFPVFGSCTYFFFESQRVRKKERLSLENQEYATKKINYNATDTNKSLQEKNKSVYNMSQYILKKTNMPIYNNTETKYFSVGEEYFEDLIIELEKAERFIFIEYFIIKQGYMWNKVFNILKRKAKQGVDVRLLYDDFGCINTLPQGYENHVRKYGIKCQVFGKIYPIATLAHNNRDHRKIVVIDGIVGFTGGINLSDEYINKWIRFGHWKDTGVMLKGEAVKSFTLMFLENWHMYEDKNEDYTVFLPKLDIIPTVKKESKKKLNKLIHKKQSEQITINDIIEANKKEKFNPTFPEISDEFVQPYMSTPMDAEEIVARNVYVNILNSALDYVYITTPYLIMDSELETAVINAAKRGIDVRIITPRIPDKKNVFAVTRSSYGPLIKEGVRIFEYVPGFIHAKNVVSDDTVATCGSINFDNRSFYHSYEIGVLMYNSESVINIRRDFIKAQNLSEEVKIDPEIKVPLKQKLKTAFWKLFSPVF